MKSIKKRCKVLLSEINASANELSQLSNGLSLLSELNTLAAKVLTAEKNLRLQLSGLGKSEYREILADPETLGQLEEIVNMDAVSTLEELLFSELESHENSAIGEFLQQLLDKVEKLYTNMLENIQELIALSNDD